MARKIRHLIVPGMAKCGTTFLWDQFYSRTDRVNIFPDKEIGYLNVGRDIEAYENFFSTKDNSKVYLDATPQYGDTYKLFAENGPACLRGREVQLIFCLRDPVARAFSHYRHDLSSHFWRSVMGDYSFYSEGSLRRYLRPYGDIVRTFANSFGKDNIFGFSFKQTTGELPAHLLDFMGLPKDWRLDLSVNPAPGGGLPRIMYDPDRPTYIEQSGSLYRLPAKTLLVCTNLFTNIIPDYPEDLGVKFVKHAQNWTKELNRAVFGSTWKEVQEDYNEALELLGMQPEELQTTGMIPYKSEMAIPDVQLDLLEKVTTVETINSKIYAEHALSMPWVSGNDDLPLSEISLAGQIEKIERAFRTPGNMEVRLLELKRLAEQFGPVPVFLTTYLIILIGIGDLDQAIKVLDIQKFAPDFIDRQRIGQAIENKMEVHDREKLLRIRVLAKVDEPYNDLMPSLA